MKRFLLTTEAKLDALEIIDRIRRENPSAAVRFQKELQETLHKLAEIPYMGHVRSDLAVDPIRFWPFHDYLIIYLPIPTPIQIIRVLHSARDVHAILDKTEP